MATSVPLNLWVLVAVLSASSMAAAAEPAASGLESTAEADRLELGRRMYMDGVLPSGEMMTASVRGDIPVTGEQVSCGACHRRSGLGSSEGQEVVPAVAGDLLYAPLRLPTSKPPLAPELRPAYTDATLKRAIRSGIRSDGEALGPFMPRYDLSDEELDILIGYLKTLSADSAPGVTGQEVHFATIVAQSADPRDRKALIDVLDVYFEQKNAGTRNETSRAENAPWHKKWVFGPYRKWVLHVWELGGPRESWQERLEEQYRQQPVFAVLSGVAPGSWEPIHAFCNESRVPCLFPTTELPVIDEQDFYSLYFSKGMSLQGEAIGQHLSDDDLLTTPVVQVFREEDPLGATAAAGVRGFLEGKGVSIRDYSLPVSAEPAEGFWRSVTEAAQGAVLVLWLGESDLQAFWAQSPTSGWPQRIYLSTTIYGDDPAAVPQQALDRVYFAHPYDLPGMLPRRLARSTGWLKFKKIYAPEAKQIQANAYFALKMAGEGMGHIRGFYSREYFLERIEHMVDNATYTSVYPHISLAPGQRFVSKGCFIAKVPPDGGGGLVAVSDWLIPGSD